MEKRQHVLLTINVLLYLFLAVFSYSYVDLNLTLSQNPAINEFIKSMQQLGYFNRPTATLIYIAFLTIAFSFFIYNLWLFKKEKVGLAYLKKSTIVSVIILIFAYPFLSSDLFNYLFDARIILKYHVSPYDYRAIDFPNDDWVRFMRWIHRYSPYGPLWLLMSLIPAVLSFGKFIINLFAFKITIGFFHLINTLIIYKILAKINPKNALFQTAFYALNPLFLIEAVANAHNDVVLTASLLMTIYFVAIAKNRLSYLALFAGALIKYISILNLPWLILLTIFKKININSFILANLATMAFFTYVYSSFGITVPFVSATATQIQFQPWYLFWTLPLVALIPNLKLMTISIFLTLGASLRYLPFLYHGDWSQPGTVNFMQLVTILPPVLAVLCLLAIRIARSK